MEKSQGAMGYIKAAIPIQSDEEITTPFLYSSSPQDHHHFQQQNKTSLSSFPSSSKSVMASYDPENGSLPTANGDNNSHQQNVVIPETAHQISTDSWLQAGFVLTTGINSAYVLGYSGAIMVPLGWTTGVVGLLAAAAISLYANALVAKLHELGGRRHIRYRDLAGYVYGPKAYSLTWALQYINLFMINTGFIILAGSSIKAAYTLFKGDDALKLPYCIILSGFVCALFAIGIPHLSALRIWLGVSTFFGLIYILIAIALSLKDGLVAETFPVSVFIRPFLFAQIFFSLYPHEYVNHMYLRLDLCIVQLLSTSVIRAFVYGIDSPPRDYSIPNEKGKIFTTIGAAANLVFAFNTGMLPEIQATVRKPVVENMMKALYFQFTIGIVPMYAIVFIGYWAFGVKTDAYLLNNVKGPVWLLAMANISAFLQTVIALHIFASPMYEYLDTRFGITGSALHPKNLGFRVLIRGGYLAINTFVSALLPFLGDFMSLTGAISTFPLTFILANHMYYKAKKNKLSLATKIWLWINIIFFSCMAIAAFISALRLIAVDSKTYHLFADL